MNDILGYLARHCAFLWAGARFRITGSLVTTVQGGDSWVDVASEKLVVRFVRDRGQLVFYLSPAQVPKEKGLYSSDLVWRLLRDGERRPPDLDESYARLLAENLDELERLFSAEQWPETRKTFAALKKQRTKDIFG